MKKRGPLIQGKTDLLKHRAWLADVQLHIDKVELIMKIDGESDQAIDDRLRGARSLRDGLEEDIALYLEFYGRRE